MIHNRSAKKYLRRVRSVLPGSAKMTKQIMEQIRNEVLSYFEEYPQADYKDLVSRFGDPETIAASYVESMGTAEILKKLRIRKRILIAVAIVLAFVVITWATTVTFEILRNESIRNGVVVATMDQKTSNPSLPNSLILTNYYIFSRKVLHIKKIISFVLVITALFAMVSTMYVSALDLTESENVILLQDGGYILIELDSNDSMARSSTTRSKTYTRYTDDNEMLWKATVTGSFTYNGTTSNCTSSNCTVTLYDDARYTVSKTAWADGNTANATVEMGRKWLGITVSRETYTLTITCDKNGNCS